MGSDTGGLGGTASGASPEPPAGSDDRLIWLPGRSPVLDAAQLGVLRGYGSERDVAADDVLFADGDETYDLIVLLAGTADIIEGYGQPGASVRGPMCKPDAVKRDEAGETELTSWTVLCRVRRGRCIWGRPLGTAERESAGS
jgi:hypothetical protein